MITSEFPPHTVGGLGVHCYYLAKSLSKKINVDVFAPGPVEKNVLKVGKRAKVSVFALQNNPQNPYCYSKCDISSLKKGFVLRHNPDRYDVIHAHDWSSVSAALELKRTGKPLVLTIHSTEYDRTANLNPWKFILQQERLGIEQADKIITVSNLMREQLIQRYGADPDKIRVIYNAISPSKFRKSKRKRNKEKIVLFLGRLTHQKGPEFFLDAAKKVLEHANAKFVVAGSGYMLPELINRAISLDIQDSVLFTGRISDEEVREAYANADVFVLPSVSEPFGITALEAMASGTPVIISKTCGVGEVASHVLKVDFWDVNELANKILALLSYQCLWDCMSKAGSDEVESFSWDDVAAETISVYREAAGR